MVKWTLIILACLCVTITIFWFNSPKAKKFIDDIGPLFSVISSLLALTVFLQFYNEIEKTKNESKEKRQEEKARLNSRMVALGSEIINNIQLCNLLEDEKENHLKGIEVPNVLFEYSVTDNLVVSGDITYHKLRSELTSLMAQMKSINNLIQAQQQLMIFKNFAPVDRQEALKQRTITSMALLHTKVPLIRQQLAATEPLFKELWNNPEKFIDEAYLKDKMLPEALIR
jgi:hypothetical protein